MEFKWTAATEKSIYKALELDDIKHCVTHYNHDLPVRHICDSSAYGLGAVISHVMKNGEERPIAFACVC